MSRAMVTTDPKLLNPVLVGGCLIVLIAFGVRASFGVFQVPIAQEFGWPRAEFSLAIAIQNLFWGFGQPMFAAMADRWGPRPALTLGIATYAAGLAASAFAVTPEGHQLLNMVIGMGVAGTGFGVILAMVSKASSEENRSLSMGLATAAGSAGQFLIAPLAAQLLPALDWNGVFLLFAGLILSTLLLLPLLRGIPAEAPAAPGDGMGAAIRRAGGDASFWLIFVGFFACGYQLFFITAHFPAFITEVCGPIDPSGLLASAGIDTTAQLGALAFGVIGAVNIGGTLLAGRLGAMFPKRYLLSIIYALRTVAAASFLLIPMTPASVLVFSAVMGALWLATVPLTAGLVGYIYGLRYMGTLYGFVFFSHQVGGFLGVYLGGALYDRYGSYDAVWWIGVGVGAFSALVHLPVRERPLEAPSGPVAA
jgi:MFS family permease